MYINIIENNYIFFVNCTCLFYLHNKPTYIFLNSKILLKRVL